MKNSIEYLINEVSEILGNTHLNSMQYLLLADALKRAREMHKEEIINSYRKARYNEEAFINSNEAEDYYNQTYNQNK
jgi:hypothetical protein